MKIAPVKFARPVREWRKELQSTWVMELARKRVAARRFLAANGIINTQDWDLDTLQSVCRTVVKAWSKHNAKQIRTDLS